MKNPEIKIVGAGLLGTSLGLALARQSVVATLEDQSKANLRLAIEYGAGVESGPEPDLVIVCVPPDLTADVVIDQLRKHSSAIVTDVASVKSKVLQDVTLALPEQSDRYIGSHPMAGREKGGPAAARADLFFARPWIITTSTDTNSEAIELIRDVALRLGALPIELSAAEHDEAVALVSHLPQLVATLLANRLNAGTQEQLGLAGQGLRDTSRIAASDPELWVQIISQNAESVSPLLEMLRADLEILSNSVANINAAGSLAKIHGLLQGGNSGVLRIPGKHGGKSSNYQVVTVVIEDAPGALASLLTFIGEIGVNLEDLNLEHSPGAPIGLVELQVLPEVATRLSEQLLSNGWRLV